MSNLGSYLVLTKLAKTVGGPIVLGALTLATGAGLGEAAEKAGKKIKDALAK